MSYDLEFKMSIEDYQSGVEESNGVCLSCGSIKFGGCEPDAEDYACDECDSNAVMGFEFALIGGHIVIT